MELWLISLLAGLTSTAFAFYLFFYIGRQESGSTKMREISAAIREGAMAFLKREYYTLTFFVAVMALILAVFLNYNTALAYVFGSICSALAGLLGMDVALKANVKTANAAKRGLVKAFLTAFYGGAVMGLSVVGLALTGISILYYVYRDPNIILGFSLGASSLALFAKAGGGIYTKTADIGADLVGKVELGIPEDDPRNPAVIADNVGDNVGDVAGTGADLFDSYVASTVSAMILGSSLERTAIQYEVYTVLPILLAAVGIFASILGTLFVRVKEGGDPGVALNRGTYSTCLLFVFFSYLLIHFLNVDLGVFYATTAGLVVGVLVGITTDYFTSINREPVKKTAEAAKMGAALNILSGFSYGVISIAPTVIGVCVAILTAWYFAGLYGISISAVGMLSITGMIVSSDAYGPIVDNAKGIAEQADLEPHVIKIGDKLDAAGNTTKAISKGFAIGAAALTVLALFASYSEIAEVETVGLSLMRPDVMIGVFIGAALPPLLSAMLILSVGRNAYRIVDEVRRQFREIPGLLQGRSKPDYAQCVDIATKGALRELSLPCALSVITPLTVGFLLGKYALGGFLAGSIVTGMIFAVFMATAGGQWDNAKKYIEEGAIGGKGSDVHKAAVIGDTVGDPFKDTAGPSLNTLICVMSLTASVFVPLILEYSLLKWSI